MKATMAVDKNQHQCNNYCFSSIIAWSLWLLVVVELHRIWIQRCFGNWHFGKWFHSGGCDRGVGGRTGKCRVISGRWSPSVIARIAKTIVWETWKGTCMLYLQLFIFGVFFAKQWGETWLAKGKGFKKSVKSTLPCIEYTFLTPSITLSPMFVTKGSMCT